MPTAVGMRHPLAGTGRPMMVSGGQQPGHQVFLNQSAPGIMMSPDHQRTVLAPSSTYMVVSSTQNRTPTSPRRSSSQV